MTSLLAILWVVYFSDCLARTSADQWSFRGTRQGQLRAHRGSDIDFIGGRLSLIWVPAVPWAIAFQASGTSFDVQQLRARARDVLDAVRPLRVAAIALYWTLLVGLSVLVITERLLPLLWVWLPVTVIAWVATLVLFFKARARVGLPAGGDAVATVVLSPLAAIRSPLVVMSHSLGAFHPVAVAAVTCSERDFLRVARGWRFDHPELHDAIVSVAHQVGLVERLSAPPASSDPELTKYCPRCHELYREWAGQCSSCAIPVSTIAD